MNFTPLYDLASLNERERQAYYEAACDYFKVPVEMHVLDFYWMDAGEGKRNLVLIAKKGATDIIRENLGISVTSLEKDAGEGYVSWIAKGQNPTGRIESAVGTASTEGLRGPSLANAVMIAQTRAIKRMTLQFAGGGLLDESEVYHGATDINRASVPLSSLATQPTTKPTTQPTTSVNNAVGTDVTEPESDAPVSVPTEAPVAAPIERKRRKRKPGISLDLPGAQTTTELGVEPTHHEPVTDVLKAPEPLPVESVKEFTPIPAAAQIGPVTSSPGMPTDEQLKAFRSRLAKYRDDVLPKQGHMIPSEGVGGIVQKLKLYALKLYPEYPDTKLWTAAIWEAFLNQLDGVLSKHGVTYLVNLIDTTVQK